MGVLMCALAGSFNTACNHCCAIKCDWCTWPILLVSCAQEALRHLLDGKNMALAFTEPHIHATISHICQDYSYHMVSYLSRLHLPYLSRLQLPYACCHEKTLKVYFGLVNLQSLKGRLDKPLPTCICCTSMYLPLTYVVTQVCKVLVLQQTLLLLSLRLQS